MTQRWNGWGGWFNDEVVAMYEIRIQIGNDQPVGGGGSLLDSDFSAMRNAEDAVKILQDFMDKGIYSRRVYRFVTNQWRKESRLYARPTKTPHGYTGGIAITP